MNIVEIRPRREWVVVVDVGGNELKYFRGEAGDWSVLMGESIEPVYRHEEVLESIFQDWMTLHDVE